MVSHLGKAIDDTTSGKVTNNVAADSSGMILRRLGSGHGCFHWELLLRCLGGGGLWFRLDEKGEEDKRRKRISSGRLSLMSS